MPQLEISTYITQIFWLFITFISLWLIMDKIIVPKIADTVEARKRKYEDYILKAEEVNNKALDALNRYEETLAAAKEKAAEKISKNEAELKDFIVRKEEEITLKLKEKIAENETKLAKEKEDTLKKADELSQLAAYEIIRRLDLPRAAVSDIKASFNEGE